MPNTNEAINTYYIIKGTLLSPNLTKKVVGNHAKDTRECYRYTIKDPSVADATIWGDIISCFTNPEDTFTPKWIKELHNNTTPEYINFKSNYILKVLTRDEAGNEVPFDINELRVGATGYFTIKVNQQPQPKKMGELETKYDTAIYLSSFLMLENGQPKNLYAGYDF